MNLHTRASNLDAALDYLIATANIVKIHVEPNIDCKISYEQSCEQLEHSKIPRERRWAQARFDTQPEMHYADELLEPMKAVDLEKILHEVVKVALQEVSELGGEGLDQGLTYRLEEKCSVIRCLARYMDGTAELYPYHV